MPAQRTGGPTRIMHLGVVEASHVYCGKDGESLAYTFAPEHVTCKHCLAKMFRVRVAMLKAREDGQS